MEPNVPTSGEPSDQPCVFRRRYLQLVRMVALLLCVWLVAAYFFMPLVWRLMIGRHPGLGDAPRITRTKHGIAGDPVNVALVGTEEQLVAAMLRANWLAADPITMKSSLRIATKTLRRRPYDTAPMSNLFAWGRKQDLAFQQPIGNDPRRRHHVRFWQSDRLDEDGRPIWIGAGTLDTSVGISRTTGQITHHIDANVDFERDKLMADLAASESLERIDWIRDFHAILSGRNGGGDRWYTDGRLPVGILSDLALPGSVPADRDEPIQP